MLWASTLYCVVLKKRSDRYPKPNGYSLGAGAGAGAGIKYYPLSFVSAGRV